MEKTTPQTPVKNHAPDYIEELLDLILRLPNADRVKIGTEIMQSFGSPDPEIEQAQIEEADRRARQMESGEVEGIPGEQVFAEIDRMLNK